MGPRDAVAGALDHGPEATSDPVADDGSAEALRRDDPEPKRFAQRIISEIPENEKSSLVGGSGDTDALEVSTTRDPPGAGKFHDPSTGISSGDREFQTRAGTGSLPVLHRVALEVNLRTLGNETLAALLAAAANDVATGLGGHAGTEPMLVLAGALGGLVSPFHLFRWVKWLPKRPPAAAFRRVRAPSGGMEGRKDKSPAGKVNGEFWWSLAMSPLPYYPKIAVAIWSWSSAVT
jgi:hypothetical protein